METKTKTKTENARIQDIGLYYDGHFDRLSIRCVVDGRGWGTSVYIPIAKMKKFVSLFGDSIDLENGIYIHELENAPVKVVLNDENSIVAIGDILSTEDEMVKLR